MDMQHTVERLAATEAIRDLVYQYSHLIDRGELPEVAALFADATYGQCDANGSPIGGLIDRDPAAVLRANESFIRMHGDPPSPRTKHLTTNVRITVADDNRTATSLAYVTVLQGAEELPLQPILTGRYFDSFALFDGQWRFTQRLCCIDHTGDLSAHARRALI
ncbi:nuclear transport factor 2 family protein [Rhodococcus sp. NPDC058514]|uniref:nuclear transport factor 2 family protein n=1 Tax=unclassified Rhodococcus (in: high G+C Gram-positive bacteria) TaxID=192944 RepID=UPI00364F1A00